VNNIPINLKPSLTRVVETTLQLANRMVQISEEMLRGRAEHNDRCLANLEEISLHQQNIEGINRSPNCQLLVHLGCDHRPTTPAHISGNQHSPASRFFSLACRALTRLCPELQILYLQHNLIPKIENLRRLRDLDYLNLALNNILKVSSWASVPGPGLFCVRNMFVFPSCVLLVPFVYPTCLANR